MPGFIERVGASFDEVAQAPLNGYAPSKKVLRAGAVFVFRCYDGAHFAKLEVLEIIDDPKKLSKRVRELHLVEQEK